MTTLLSSQRAQRVGLLTVIVLALGLYAPSLFYGFTYDDHRNILGNPGVTGPFSLRFLLQHDTFGNAFSSAETVGVFRPLVSTSFWIDHHLAGGGAWPFHLTNLVCFGLVLWAADRLLRSFALALAARLSALLLFAVLAIHADVVPSPTGRAELLATLFSLLSLGIATRAETSKRALGAMALALVAAALCKESAYPVPLLAAAFALRRGNRRGAAVAAASLLLVPALRLSLGIPRWTTAYAMEYANPLLGRRPLPRLGGAGEALTHYLEHVATGVDLCPDYGYAALTPTLAVSLRAVLGLGLMLVVGGFALARVRRNPRVVDAVFGFVVSYVVVSHVLIAGSAFVADRLFFFPSFWLCLLVGLGIDKASARIRLVGPVVLMLSAEQALTAALTMSAWRDDRALFSHAVVVCPNNHRMHLGRAYVASVDRAPLEAAWHVLVAAAILDRFPRPIAEDTFPASWAELPMGERLARLTDAVGGPQAFARVHRAAHDLAVREDHLGAAMVLTKWPVALAPP